jgi:hypothetical protein
MRLAGVTVVTELTRDRATERPDLDDAAGPPDRYERPPTDPPPALSVGVELARLLALARLTPAQALELAASVLAEATRPPAPDGETSGSDNVTMDQVVIGPDGRVVLRAPAHGRRTSGPPVVEPSGPSVETVIAELAGAARLAGRREDPAAEQRPAVLDLAVTELPVAGVASVARTLEGAADAIDRAAVRAELAALVTAVSERVAPTSGLGPASARSTAVRAVPAGRVAHGGAGSARRRIGAWLLSALVLAGVVLLEVAVLRDRIVVDIGQLLDAGRSGSAPSAAPKPDGLPIVPPAPAAAGTVTGVDLRPLAPCAPGAPCTVRVLVRLHPAAGQQVVTWSYHIVDRCTGATTTAPGGSVTVPAAGERAAVVGTVPLPAVPGVALVAVTALPAAAASGPVSIGTCAPDGQAR